MVSAELGIGFWRSFDCVAGKKKGEKGSWDPPGAEAAMCSSLLASRVEWVGKEKKKNACNNLNLKANFDLIEFSSPSVFDFRIYLYIQALQAWGLAEWILNRDAHVLTISEFWILYTLVKFTPCCFVTYLPLPGNRKGNRWIWHILHIIIYNGLLYREEVICWHYHWT